MRIMHNASGQMNVDIFGFVIIPNYVHILLQPRRNTISKVMSIIKGRSARIINLINTYSSTTGASASSGAPHLNCERKHSLAGCGGIKHTWHKSFHDHIIRGDNDFRLHIEYLRINPIKHGLVKEGEAYPYLCINKKLVHKLFDK